MEPLSRKSNLHFALSTLALVGVALVLILTTLFSSVSFTGGVISQGPGFFLDNFSSPHAAAGIHSPSMMNIAIQNGHVMPITFPASFESVVIRPATPIQSLTPLWRETTRGVQLSVSFDRGVTWCDAQNGVPISHPNCTFPTSAFTYRVTFSPVTGVSPTELDLVGFNWDVYTSPPCPAGQTQCETITAPSAASGHQTIGINPSGSSLVGNGISSNGWTAFTPSSTASPGNTRIVYVSTSGTPGSCEPYDWSLPADRALIGSDPFHPLTTTRACATLLEAHAHLRSGSPDWMLLKKGDAFPYVASNGAIDLVGSSTTDRRWKKGGKSPNEPLLVSSYGTGARPLLRTGDRVAIATDGGGGTPKPLSYIAFVGLHFEAKTWNGAMGNDGVGDQEGVNWLQHGEHVL
ncbi:MAG: hypothetical protein AABY11_03690, partial [archaeon]